MSSSSSSVFQDWWNGESSLSSHHEIWHPLVRAAAGGDESVIDYSVLSVGVMTLVLLLFVAVVRHWLDQRAKGRRFFQTVLEGVYTELATLGMVELFIFLLHKYYENLNVARELVFADVHFTLFYTAIFNAFQSCILAHFCRKQSQHDWVATEQLELDHYVELREAFDRLQKQLQYGQRAVFDETTTTFWKDTWLSWRFPHQVHQYQRLLVQIRFHELRLAFLKTNQLPLQFQVSSYLKRCELHVLCHMVHVSTVAWWLLTGAANLIYFGMGMVASVTSSIESVGRALVTIYFGGLALFLLLSWLVQRKMNRVFLEIMNRSPNSAHPLQTRQEQLDLFWASDASLVLSLVQFIQFGFAIDLSILILFWEEFAKANLSKFVFWLVLGVCYVFFVIVVSRHVIPRYTLCTSLGQLVDLQRLHETHAVYRLEQAQKQQRVQAKTTRIHSADSVTVGFSTSSLVFADEDTVASVATNNKETLLASLVDTDTDSLRPKLPKDAQMTLQTRDDLRRQRKARRKALSDGVAAMRQGIPAKARTVLGAMSKDSTFSTAPSFAPTQDDAADIKAVRRRRHQRRKSNSASANIQAMREMHRLETTPEEPAAVAAKDDADVEVQKRRERRPRLKSHSASADIQSMRHLEAMGRSHQGPPSAGKMEMLGTPLAPSTIRPPLNRRGSFDNPLDTLHEHDTEVSKEFSAVPIVDRIPDEAIKDPQEDQDLLETQGSEGGQSDADDIPEIDKSVASLTIKDDMMAPVPFQERLRGLFRSDKYPVLSAVMGTMPCFFVLGMRIEVLLHKLYVIPDTGNTLEFTLETGFWLTVSFLSVFFVISAGITVLFRPSVCANNKDRSLFIAGLMDVTIIAVCLVVFLVAETERCCAYDKEEGYNDPHLRFLAPDPVEEKEPGDCCPVFGKRYYGGVGRIEPFTSLIALRLLRFAAARFLVGRLALKFGWPHAATEKAEESAVSRSSEVVAGGENVAKGESKEGPLVLAEKKKVEMAEACGSAVDLWETAIGLFPELVEKHGHFSSELLQAMLGIDIVAPSAPTEKHAASASVEPSSASVGRKESTGKGHTKHRRVISLTGKQYEGLSPEAQGIIIAGKIGKAVKSSRNLLSLAGNEPAAKGSSCMADMPSGSSSPLDVTPMDNTPHKFELDDNPLVTDTGLSFFNVEDPNARLVRSMRRCDRKLLPLLESWAAVDVVLTQSDLIYFDAVEFETENQLVGDGSLPREIHNVRQALKATKGGKGLRLCDISMGRKVVGRLKLSDIISVHVERHIHEPGALDHDPVDQSLENEIFSDEFWETRATQQTKDTFGNRNARWSKTREDQLTIHSIHGTLALRFYSDLTHLDTHPDRYESENLDEGPLVKNNALQWAQTLVRFCGTSQLKQSLPHFGADPNDEIRDFLIIVRDNEKKGIGKIRLAPSTIGLDMLLAKNHRRTLSSAGQQVVVRSASFGEGGSVPSSRKEEKLSRLKMRRSSSLPEDSTGSGAAGDLLPKPKEDDDDDAFFFGV